MIQCIEPFLQAPGAWNILLRRVFFNFQLHIACTLYTMSQMYSLKKLFVTSFFTSPKLEWLSIRKSEWACTIKNNVILEQKDMWGRSTSYSKIAHMCEYERKWLFVSVSPAKCPGCTLPLIQNQAEWTNCRSHTSKSSEKPSQTSGGY